MQLLPAFARFNSGLLIPIRKPSGMIYNSWINDSGFIMNIGMSYIDLRVYSLSVFVSYMNLMVLTGTIY